MEEDFGSEEIVFGEKIGFSKHEADLYEEEAEEAASMQSTRSSRQAETLRRLEDKDLRPDLDDYISGKGKSRQKMDAAVFDETFEIESARDREENRWRKGVF